MNELILELEKIKPLTDFFTALIPIVLSIFVILIAIQQYRTNRRKLKLDLFEKRYKVFDVTIKFIGDVVRSQNFEHQTGSDFLEGTRGAEFLFDAEIKLYIDEIWERAVNISVWAEDESTSTHAAERNEHMKWFVKQLREVDQRFKKYMQLSH